MPSIFNPMPSHLLHINSLKHCAYKDQLDELFGLIVGQRVVLTIEHENCVQRDAVMCLFKGRHLGYVRAHDDLDEAQRLFRQSGARTIRGVVVEADERYRTLLVEVQTADVPSEAEVMEEDRPIIDYDGPLLNLHSRLSELHALQDTMEAMVAEGLPYDEEMQDYLKAMRELQWLDISRESQDQRNRLLHMVARHKQREGYPALMAELRGMMDAMGSREVRQRQVQHLMELVESRDMELMVAECGKRVEEYAAMLPRPMLVTFMCNGEELMGQLWYLNRPMREIRAVVSLLALNVWLGTWEDRIKAKVKYVPVDFICAWGLRSEKEGVASLVSELLKDFYLESTHPELAQKSMAEQAAAGAKKVVVQGDMHLHTDHIVDNHGTFVENMNMQK